MIVNQTYCLGKEFKIYIYVFFNTNNFNFEEMKIVFTRTKNISYFIAAIKNYTNIYLFQSLLTFIKIFLNVNSLQSKSKNEFFCEEKPIMLL